MSNPVTPFKKDGKNVALEVGQKWNDNSTPGREVVVCGWEEESGKIVVQLQFKNRNTYASLKRFNGRKNGYSLVA